MGRAQMMFAGGASAVVLAAIVGGLMLTGSPGALRLLRLDEQKVQDLRNLATAIDNYEDRHKTLPETLEALTAEEQWNVLRLADPETNSARCFTRQPMRPCSKVFFRRSGTTKPDGTALRWTPPGAIFSDDPARPCALPR
jgi:type II secretory pathway pseudopilin PulG